jgi:sugar (pentulose or hexulose) kinase
MTDDDATRERYWNRPRVDVLGRSVRLPASTEASLGMAVLAARSPDTAPEPDKAARDPRPTVKSTGAPV